MKYIAELRDKMHSEDALGIMEWLYFNQTFKLEDILQWLGENSKVAERVSQYYEFYEGVWWGLEYGHVGRDTGSIGRKGSHKDYNHHYFFNVIKEDPEFAYELFQWTSDILQKQFSFFTKWHKADKEIEEGWKVSCGFVHTEEERLSWYDILPWDCSLIPGESTDYEKWLEEYKELTMRYEIYP